MAEPELKLIKTIKKRCRVCYTCVRECPAKAIRIVDGQADVMHKRCIACGNCIRVCSQNAKQMVSTVPEAVELLDNHPKVAGIVAPSFAAEFSEYDYATLVGMIRALGFDYVFEVAFGADLVAKQYARLLNDDEPKQYITTSCPATVHYIERYFPQLLDNLMPVVSPMIAMARVVHELHGDDTRIVFIGPCIAKKGETAADELQGEVDAAVTFIELREMFLHRRVNPGTVNPSDFDPPRALKGGLFPLKSGELQAAGIEESLIADNVVSADGHKEFDAAIKSFARGDIRAKVVDILCCEGCVMGQGMSSKDSPFIRRSRVSEYVRRRLANSDKQEWEQWVARFDSLALTRKYSVDDQRIKAPSGSEIEEILRRMGKVNTEDELNCGACGYETCREHAIAIFKGLAESEMCLPYTIEKLHSTVSELHQSHEELASTQEQLMHSERLASMGQLAAGIAHEVNNPLGVVLMYAHLLLEQQESEPEVREDLSRIVRETERCRSIVAGLLDFARQNKVEHQQADMANLLERALGNIDIPAGIAVDQAYSGRAVPVEMDESQMLQVFINLISNAVDAMGTEGRLTLEIEEHEHDVSVKVADTGWGIPEDVQPKIFEPFYTTKPMGKGTGLGLSVTYGIVKMHRGQIEFDTNTDESKGPVGTCFTVTIPRRRGGDNGSHSAVTSSSAKEQP